MPKYLVKADPGCKTFLALGDADDYSAYLKRELAFAYCKR